MAFQQDGPPNKRIDGLWDWLDAEVRQRRCLSKDEFLFHRGDPVTNMFRVESGTIRLERRTIDGRLLILHSARPGELLAEASLFSDVYHCDASAAEASLVSTCAKADLLGAMVADPAKALGFATLLSRKVQALRHRLEFRNVRSAADRILLFLELHADPVTRQMKVEGALQDIAAELGLTREALYRTLSALERNGTIERRAGTIVLSRPSV